MNTLTPSDFLLMTESRLRPTGTPFSRAALVAFAVAERFWQTSSVGSPPLGV
jgi:hypothetical protein